MTPIPPIPEDPPEICKEYCKDCGAETATWFTDSDIWNLLDTPGILCPNCFVHLIEARGFATTGWKLVPEERIAKLTAEVARLTVFADRDVFAGKYQELLDENTRLKATLGEIEKYAIYGCGTKQKDRRGNQFAAIVDLASRATRTPPQEGQ